MNTSGRPLLSWSAAACALALCSSGCSLSTGTEDLAIDDRQSDSGQGGHAALIGGPSCDILALSPICDETDCGEHGRCVVVSRHPACLCDPGYQYDGDSCVPIPPPEPCDSIVCGAHATCVDAECVCLDGYEGDPEAGCEAINPDEAIARAELVQIAQAEIGYCEGVDDRPYISETDGWCYFFVNWVYASSSYPIPGPMSLPQVPIDDMPAWWQPEPGDYIKFTTWHAGMVEEVLPNGTSMKTIEGNVNECVYRLTRSFSKVEYFGTLDPYF